jgi:quercetin dioxygenase-like cupin family protein
MSQHEPVRKAGKVKPEEFPWGRLLWFAGGQIGNADELTVGECIIKPGCENPTHAHSNCEEVLYVQSGAIRHSYGDEAWEMGPGDTITVPRNVPHNARNIGADEAVLFICFSAADRKAENEE